MKYSNDEIAETIHTTVKPLNAEVQFLDRKNQISVYVSDLNGLSLLKAEGLFVRRIRTVSGMASLVEGIKENLKERGYLTI